MLNFQQNEEKSETRGVGGGCDTPLWVQGKALVETRWQSFRKFKGFSTLKSLTFVSVQSYASLIHKETAYVQITHHDVCYLKYTELKRFFVHRVSVPKPGYRLLNPFRYVYAVIFETMKQSPAFFLNIKLKHIFISSLILWGSTGNSKIPSLGSSPTSRRKYSLSSMSDCSLFISVSLKTSPKITVNVV